MTELSLMEKINTLPPEYRQEVEDFVDFIREKKLTHNHTLKNRLQLFGVFRDKIKMQKGFDDPIEGMEDYR